MNSKSRASKLVALAQNVSQRSRRPNVQPLPVRQSARLRNITKVSSPTVKLPAQNCDFSSYDCHEGTTEHERELLLSRKNQLFAEAESFDPNPEETPQPLRSLVIPSSTSQDVTHDTHSEETHEISDIDSSVYISSSDSYVPSPNKMSSYESSYNTSTDKVNSSQVIDIPVAPIARGALSNSSSSDDEDDVDVSTVKKVNGKRKRDKLHCCYFCNKLLSNNMARHFEKVHNCEVDVSRILAFPKGSAERRKRFASLIRCGDFYYNCNVLTIKKGRLILVRRPDKKGGFSYSDFSPCPNCLGFMAKKYIWHHVKYSCTCTTNKRTSSDDDKSKRAPLNESSALLFQFQGRNNFSEAFQKEVVSAFRLDEVSQECKGDDLILRLGAFMFEKYGTKQLELIRQTMRQVGRLKVELKKIHRVESMSDMLTPANFDTVVTATRNLCETYMAEDVRLNFKIPSLALKIGHHLRKCVAIERGTALRSGNMQRAEELRNLLELIHLEWSTRISSNALASLHKKKLNATQLLPLTSDLIKLNSYLINEIKSLTVKVRTCCNRQLWGELASVTLCRIILFNKRRSGEASRMTLENYSTRPSWNEQTTSEFKDSLSPVEKELANRLAVVQIIGKRNRVVPVIMPEDVKVAIDTLIKTREEGDISPNNSYVFARSVASRSNRYLHGHHCLRKACQNADLECAQNITSTKLRKYMATVCQIFDLKEHECDWLARHLGHDLTVHRDFYRMHESAIELTKVSRLLLAVESGKANQFAGRQLHEINVEDLPDMEEDDVIVNEIDGGKGETNTTDVTDLTDEDVNSVNDESDINEDCCPPSTSTHFTKNKNKRRKLTDQHHKIPKKAAIRKPWFADALSIVAKFFDRDIKHARVPGKVACEECIAKSDGVLSDRKWTDIKFCVKNQITRQSRLTNRN